MRVRSIKGMSDILPAEVSVWQWVEKTAREVFEGFGYEEIRTPILEETALFQQAIGEGTDIVNKEMYTFEDKGGRSLTLRPEGTAPIVRAYIENCMGVDDYVKLYYIGPMFRSERPQKGRKRQFHQVGVEVIGPSNPRVDAAAIQVMARFFSKLGLQDFTLKLCSLGCEKDKKRLAAELRSYLIPERNRLCSDCKARLDKNVLRILDCKVESCRTLLRNAPQPLDFLCQECRVHYQLVKRVLEDVLDIRFEEDSRMVRGLDYYTSTVFEVTHGGVGAQDAIAAGGRYDNLIEDFGGKKTGAFGFAIGVERLLMALASEKKIGQPAPKPLHVYVALTDIDSQYREAQRLIDSLRDKGCRCEINLLQRSLKSQMRRANRKNARFVVLFGEDEWKRQEVVLRDMRSSMQENVKADNLVAVITQRLNGRTAVLYD